MMIKVVEPTKFSRTAPEQHCRTVAEHAYLHLLAVCVEICVHAGPLNVNSPVEKYVCLDIESEGTINKKNTPQSDYPNHFLPLWPLASIWPDGRRDPCSAVSADLV